MAAKPTPRPRPSAPLLSVPFGTLAPAALGCLLAQADGAGCCWADGTVGRAPRGHPHK